MEKKELSQLYHLNREIEHDKQRLAELESAATKATISITGIPHGGDLADKTALAAEIADLKGEIEAKIRLTVVNYNRLMRYINSIDDSLMRQIVTLRHVNGFSWREVAEHIGGNNTEGSVRMAYSRFFGKK